MPSLWQAPARSKLLLRLSALKPDAPARWGRMSCPQMLAHLNACQRMANGELATTSKRSPIRYPPLKQLIIYVLPFPKGAPSVPELLPAEAQAWQTECEAFQQLLEAFAARPREGHWPEHPGFGRLTPRAWGVLCYRHIDHHFNQFGA